MQTTFIHKHIYFRAFILSLILGVVFHTTLICAEEGADEDMYTGSARIESKTELNSAQCIINGSDQADDRKRKNLGAGELVTLTLKGKPSLVGENSSIEWSIDNNSKKYAQFNDSIVKGKRSVKVEVNKHLPDASSIVRIQVKTDALEEPITITFTVYRPQKNFDVKNTKAPIQNYTDNGDTANFGASTKLELTVKPLNVSFKNIRITEINEDEGPPNPSQSLWEYHNPSLGANPDDRNVIPDYIGFPKTPVETVRGEQPVHVLPQHFVWKSSWIVDTAFDEKPFEIQKSEQVFDLRFLDGNQDVRTTITKFGCSVSRTTEPGNTQQY